MEGEAPSPRSGHTAVALPGERYLVVFGGGIPENNCFFSTVALLDTWTWTWTVPTLQVRLPSSPTALDSARDWSRSQRFFPLVVSASLTSCSRRNASRRVFFAFVVSPQ